jgi:hypothetical protein
MNTNEECKWGCEDGIVPCDNCEETDEHECWLDGEMYGPYPCPKHSEEEKK